MRDLNQRERVSFLLAEQNTNIALRYADYGYILENGRVMMDGAAADLAQNEDVKEFYLGISSGERKSFATTSSIAAASAGWPSDTPHKAAAGRILAPPATTPQYGTREGAIPCPSFSMSWKHERPSNASAS